MEHTSQGWNIQVTRHCTRVSQAKGLETQLPPSEYISPLYVPSAIFTVSLTVFPGDYL